MENDREQMSAVADRLLRLMVATKAPVSDYSLDALAELGEESSPVPLLRRDLVDPSELNCAHAG